MRAIAIPNKKGAAWLQLPFSFLNPNHHFTAKNTASCTIFG